VRDAKTGRPTWTLKATTSNARRHFFMPSRRRDRTTGAYALSLVRRILVETFRGGGLPLDEAFAHIRERWTAISSALTLLSESRVQLF
jgi:hypothetical protein